MKHEGFTPIGQTARTVAPESLSADGSNAGQRGFVASRPDTLAVAAWLSRQEPSDMDKAAVSRASSHSVGLRVRYEGRYPTGPNGEYLPSYQVAVGCEVSGTPEQAQAALADLYNFLTPPPKRQIEEWLAELSVIVAKRADDQFAEALRLEAYSSRLAVYPADVVRTVLRDMTYKFWPTWDELERNCEALASPRRNMIAALERHKPLPPVEERRAATDDEKKRIADLVAEMFPNVSQEWKDAAVAEATKGNCFKQE